MADARLDAFQPLRVQRAGDDVLAVLVDAIRGGLYRPGDHLPTQVELAAQLGVSRGVVREAMMALRRAGVVSVRRGRGGTVVASLEHLDDVLVQIRGQTRETLRTVLEARRVLESAAALLAAKRAKRSDWRELRALAGQLEALSEDPALFVRTDAAFHVAIARLSGNALLERFLRETFDEVIATTARLPVGRISTTEAIAMQHDLLVALESRDASAIAGAVDDHLAPLERALVGRRLSAV
ncbi:HTH-type transcriptional repressor NanR [Capillimicrobium parvum]|uniref:HTH-type transcriptional repressor NanR n=1 Tax=Capillimicrobium parvum TaxID=2884022 RepID=A0A9E6XVP7_9ACTN|nr:HTH-type transcriptional repressor NanR [Capillimicrobium parvum]